MNRSHYAKILILTLFSSSYFLQTWWKFVPATAGIIFLAQWGFRDGPQRLGIRIPKAQLLTASLIGIVSFFCFHLVIQELLSEQNLFLDRIGWHVGWRLLPVFQTLNEEMVLRALLLGALLPFVRNTLLLSTSVAFIFTLLHWVLYTLLDNQSLHLSTEATLFFFGFSCNALFLVTGHIAFPYALHLAWNMTRFSGTLRSSIGPITEATGFNQIEGSHLLMSISFVVSVLAVWLLKTTKAGTQSRLSRHSPSLGPMQD